MVASLLAVAAVVAGAGAYVWFVLVPDYRTAFLVDASAGPAGRFGAIAAAVGSAARNSGDGDALSVRRFGGACGATGTTAEVVPTGRGQGDRIATAARALAPSGAATLGDGVLAAIDDFSGLYPFRGKKVNRIVVVTGHGEDACVKDQAALRKTIQDRIAAAGLTLEFRFVGYQVPKSRQGGLRQLAAATGAPEPRFATSAEDLTTVLHKLTIPGPAGASHVTVPGDTPAPEPSEKKKQYDFFVLMLTGWGVKVSGAPVSCAAKTNETSTDEQRCRFTLAEGQRIRLTATIHGPDPNPMRAENNPYYRPMNTPYWYGCDEGPRSRTCTVTMDAKRVSKPVDTSAEIPATSRLACVATEDPAAPGGGMFTCAGLTGAPPPPMPRITYADGSVDAPPS
ncbi:hypothetical protein ABZ860_20395 [Microbispora sp. NPDC046973]|uniref:hypothetical protein n=1 Tax=Microbispora sp. NPDC046973 TaxID=3155022 RepID=UPI0033D6824B